MPRAALDYVTRQINALSEDAQARVLEVLRAIEWKPGDAGSVAACRLAVVGALETIMPAYADAAAQLSADFYDASRELIAGEPLGAKAISGYDPRATEGAVRSFVRFVVRDGDADAFTAHVLQRVDYELKLAANVSMVENAARDPLKPKYARVPTGSETCGFCLMLASRGFAYTTADAASHAHAGCDCRVVAGFDGLEVEGYDPQALHSDYLDGKFGTFNGGKGSRPQPAQSGRGGPREFESVGDMARYLRDAPDLEALYSRGDEVQAALGYWFSDRKTRGKYLAMVRQAASRRHGELSSTGGRGVVVYTKPRSELEPHEASGIDRLSELGNDIETIPEAGGAPANLDIVMNGDEWEMKNVTNARGSVSNQMRRIREKWAKLRRDDKPRGVITCYGCDASLDDVCDGVSLRAKVGERYLIIHGEDVRSVGE